MNSVEERKRAARVLVAEDDGSMRDFLAYSLRQAGYEVLECSGGSELFRLVQERRLGRVRSRIDLIVSDLRMPDMTGLDFLTLVRGFNWDIPVILITAFGNEHIHVRATQLGAAAVLDKPFDMDDLLEKVRAAVPSGVGADDPRSGP